VPPPDPAAPAGEFGFKFDRSGYRVPAILVSPWVEQGSVFNDEYRHTSLIATLRKSWNLGEAFTERDASARTFDHLLTLETPRDPQTWATITALPVPEWHMDEVVVGKALSTLGRAAGGALFHNAQEAGIPVPPELTDPAKEPDPQVIVPALRDIAAHIFPRLATDTPETGT
jgi:phospholipase C